MIRPIHRANDLERIEGERPSFLVLIFHSQASASSAEALKRLHAIAQDNPEVPIYSIDVKAVPDIHAGHGVVSVPTVVVLRDGKMTNQVAGLQSREYYELLLSDVPISMRPGDSAAKSHNVVVYTSSTCSWCGAVKTYLRKNRISFREVDISRDENAARSLVRRSGQMGVPQTDIDGKIIVGFNQAALDRQLGIRNE